MMEEGFPENISCWGGVVFEKWVNKINKNNCTVYAKCVMTNIIGALAMRWISSSTAVICKK